MSDEPKPETSLVKAKTYADVDPQAVSYRLVFVKENAGDKVWHIVDVSLVRRDWGVKCFMALHGKFVKSAAQADSISQLQIAVVNPDDYICERCFEEMTLAAKIIERKKLLRME